MEKVEQKLPVSVYAEITPNPATMKFVCSISLTPQGTSAEFTSPESTKEAPLAARLFSFPFVTGVFISNNFITVTKNDLVEWQEVFGEVREYIGNYLSTGHEVFTAPPQANEQVKTAPAEAHADINAPQQPSTEMEHKIVQILEEYVRPAVESDGGAIDFHSYDGNGKLTVILKGACSGCPSSSVTLKNGIQGLFTQMLPEIQEIVALEE